MAQCSGHWLASLLSHHIPTRICRAVPPLTGVVILVGSSFHSTSPWLIEGTDVCKAGQSPALRFLKSEYEVRLSLLGGKDKDVSNSHTPLGCGRSKRPGEHMQKAVEVHTTSQSLLQLCSKYSCKCLVPCSLNKPFISIQIF